MEYAWIAVPESHQLTEKSRWADLGNNKFAALRHLILVVEQNTVVKNGPLSDQVEWPVNSEYIHQHRKKNIIKYTAGINESISAAVTRKLSTEVIAKVNAGLNTGKILSATLASELQTKVNSELTESLNQGLTFTKTFETQEETEITETLKFTVPKATDNHATRKVNIYNKVKETRWDIYLHSSEYLQLEYQKRWYWKDVRNTIQADSAFLKQPLFSIVFYEPVPSPSYCFDDYQPEVAAVSEITTQALNTACPSRTAPALESLENLARLAFPVSKKERKNAVKRASPAGLDNTHSAYKTLPRKKAAKKAAPKKKVAKKAAPKKMMRRKASPKKIMQKKAYKKSARR